jgi:N-acetylmuramoyl-L-alanine amidase
MSTVDRLKRQIVRDLVRENVDLIQGVPPRRVRRRDGLWLTVRVLSFAILSLGLFGSARLISTLNEPRPAAVVAAVQAASAAARPPGPAAPPVQAGANLPPPEPIDAAVFPLAVRKVTIDAGHGGSSLGTRTPLGLIEKDLTLDIAERLRRELEKDSFEVLMTRQEDEDVPLDRRAVLANESGSDIFVSVHLNWIEDRKSRGVETYYLGPTDDPYLTRLAASENRDSGYSMADMRHLLDRLYAGVRQDKSRKLAEVVQSSLFRSLGQVNPEIENRGVKAAPFIVLLSTEMPAILAEVSCLSNDEEARLLSKPLYRQYIAEALAQGIRRYADAVAGAPEAGEKGI